MRCGIDHPFFQVAAILKARAEDIHQTQTKWFDLHPKPPDQHTAKDRTKIVAGPADDNHDPDQEGKAQWLIGSGG